MTNVSIPREVVEFTNQFFGGHIMKLTRILLIALLCIPMASFAWQVEASLGINQYNGSKAEHGLWRQDGPRSQGFIDDQHMRTTAYSLGVVEELSPNWSMRAGYTNLGTATSAATATRFDPEFDFNKNECISNCNHLSTYVGAARVYGLHLTGVRKFSYGEYKPFVEFGMWYYKNAFRLWKYEPPYQSVYQIPVHNTWRFGPVAGFGVEKGNTSVSMTLYWIEHPDFDYPSIVDGRKVSAFLAVRQKF